MKIKELHLKNFRFFGDEDYIFNFDCKNTLIYGENGSGKTSIFKAFELLVKIRRDNIENYYLENKNIFNDMHTEINYKFDDNQELKIVDNSKIDETNIDFINNFSLINPILDYKRLLYINFTTDMNYQKINLFPMLDKLFENYPVDIDKNILLKDISNPNDKLEHIKTIINNILDDINIFLQKFTDEFYIEKFIYTTDYIPLAKSLGLNNALEFIINIEIKFKNKTLKEYHNFLNEAKLTSLAISIYLAIIKYLSKKVNGKTLNLLVFDDILISLDMSNRMKLLDILEEDFNDFQIIFLTHDKNLFDMYKSSFDKKYELYINNLEENNKPFIKITNTYIEKAMKFLSENDYECSANMLRKELEDILKNSLDKKDLKDKDCNDLNLEKLIQKKLKDTDLKDILNQIKEDKNNILNPLSHKNSRTIYKIEILNALENIKELKSKMEII